MTTRRPNSPARFTLSVAGLCAALTLSACVGYNAPGGPRASRDRFIYESTEWMPQTVTVRDTRTGEAIWSMDVPVGRQLIMQFRPGRGEGDYYPDSMEWALADRGKGARLDMMISVPGPTARIVEPTLRPAPEMPGAILAPEDRAVPMPIDELPEPLPPEEPLETPAEEPPAQNAEENGGNAGK
jgi:hypothetical protein